MTTKPTLVFIHGAFSTNNAFNYYKLNLRDYPQISFSHDWNDPTSVSGKRLAAELTKSGVKDVILLGHSLGGNVAIQSLSHTQNSGINVHQVITYGSPFGGSKAALMMRFISPQPVFKHIAPNSREIKTLKTIARKHNNITCFVTNRGPLSAANDGVVTVESQMALKGPVYIPVATNHMEVLLSDVVLEQTRQIIESVHTPQLM